MIERVTVVKFRVNYGGGNGAGCFEVKVYGLIQRSSTRIRIIIRVKSLRLDVRLNVNVWWRVGATCF